MLKKQPEVTDLKSVTECKYDRLQKDYTRFNMAIPGKKTNKGRGEKGLRTQFLKKSMVRFSVCHCHFTLGNFMPKTKTQWNSYSFIFSWSLLDITLLFSLTLEIFLLAFLHTPRNSSEMCWFNQYFKLNMRWWIE